MSRLQVLFNGAGGVYRAWLNTSLNSGKGSSQPTDRGGDPTDPQQGNGALLNVLLMPTEAGPYAPGQVVEVGSYVAQTGGAADIFIRGQQFDTEQTDENLGIELPLTHEDADIDFWDFSTQFICGILASQCGSQHFIVDNLVDDPFLSITFTGLEQDDETQLIIPGDDSNFKSGVMNVTMPQEEGCYILDVVNGNEVDPNKGFYLVFGFGTEGDP